MAAEAPREQEQSIKARKRELFEAAKKDPTGPLKRFAVYVAQTPPAPLTNTQKYVLFVIGGLVVLVLLIALMTIPNPRRKVRARPAAPAPASASPTR